MPWAVGFLCYYYCFSVLVLCASSFIYLPLSLSVPPSFFALSVGSRLSVPVSTKPQHAHTLTDPLAHATHSHEPNYHDTQDYAQASWRSLAGSSVWRAGDDFLSTRIRCRGCWAVMSKAFCPDFLGSSVVGGDPIAKCSRKTSKTSRQVRHMQLSLSLPQCVGGVSVQAFVCLLLLGLSSASPIKKFSRTERHP